MTDHSLARWVHRSAGRRAGSIHALAFVAAVSTVLAGLISPARAAGPPDPLHCYVPGHITIVGSANGVPDPMGDFTVRVRDADGTPCAGVVVTLDLAGAPEVRLCDPQPIDQYVSCTQVSATTDLDGSAAFNVTGAAVAPASGHWSTTSVGTFVVGSVTIGTSRVAATDLDGSYGVTANDVHMYLDGLGQHGAAVMDIDGVGGLTALDLVPLLDVLFRGSQTDLQPLCGVPPVIPGTPLSGSLILQPATTCTEAPLTTFCNGPYTYVACSVYSPVSFGEVTAVDADLTIVGPPGLPLPAFWQFGSGCHNGGLSMEYPTDFTDCYANSPVYLDSGDGAYVIATGGITAFNRQPADPINEGRVRVLVIAQPTYVGPGVPQPPGYNPCTYGYGSLPALANPAPQTFVFRIKNTPTCGGTCSTVPPVKIRLNSITFSGALPDDPGRMRDPRPCLGRPQAVPARAAGGGFRAADTVTGKLVLYPDDSGSNILVVDGSTDDVATGLTAHAQLWLSAPAPNPAPGPTQVRFGLPEAGTARVAIVDVAGRAVRVLDDRAMSAGEHTLAWDGRDANGELVRAGVYWIRLDAGGERRSATVVRVN